MIQTFHFIEIKTFHFIENLNISFHWKFKHFISMQI